MNKITCILGVRDMGQSASFYRDGLGFKTDCVEDSPRVCFFDTPGTKFELYPLERLAEDIRPDDPPAIGGGFGGITRSCPMDSATSENVTCPKLCAFAVWPAVFARQRQATVPNKTTG